MTDKIEKALALLEEAKELSTCARPKCPCCLDWLEVADQAIAILTDEGIIEEETDRVLSKEE